MAVKTTGKEGVPERGWKVKSPQPTPKFGDWKTYWESNSGKSWPKLCGLAGCNNPATAVLIVEHPSLSGAFIVPTCSFCSKRSGEVALKPDVTMVSVS